MSVIPAGALHPRISLVGLLVLAPLVLAACGSSSSSNSVAPNQAPTAVGLTLSTDEDTPVNVVLQGSDSDGSIAVYAITTAPANGSLSGTAPNLTYTPDANYFGTDSFVYRVTDNDGATATATATLTINAVNDAPIAAELDLTTVEDTPLNVLLQGNDIDGSIAAYAVTTPPANGNLTGTAPNLTYAPNANYFGPDSFVYQVTDNEGATATATVALTINAVNDAPAAVDDSFDASGSAATTIDAPGVLANDGDIDSPGADLTVTAETVTTREGGTAAISADGAFTYTPPAAFISEDSFDYTLNDNDATDPQIATGTVTITLISPPEGLSIQGLPATLGETVEARFLIGDTTGLSFTYQWSVDGGWTIGLGQGTDTVTLTAPAVPAAASLSLIVSDSNNNRVSTSLPLSLAGDSTPVLDGLLVRVPSTSEPIDLAVAASDPGGLAMNYAWTSDSALVASGDSSSWRPPLRGRYRIDIDVDNGSETASGFFERNYIGGADWPFFRGSRQGTGSRIPVDTSGSTGAVTWQTAFTAGFCSVSDNFVPGVVQAEDGTLYVGSSSDGRLYAFEPGNDTELWAFTTAGSSINGTPVIGDDRSIYVVESGGTVYAVNPDGSERWSFPTGATVTGSPAIGGDGTLYVGTDAGATSVLYALNTTDGSEKWAAPFALDAETRSSVNFAADGTVYARDYAGNLFAINPDDGSLRWQVTQGGGSGASPAIAADGTVYFGSFAPARLFAVAPDGTPKWDTDMGDPALVGIGATPAIGADGTVYVGVWEPGIQGSIYAIDPADGSVNWQQPLNSLVQSSAPAIGADGTVYVGSQLGTLYALDPDTGAERWSSTISASPSEDSPSPLSIGANGNLYVYACDGVLRAFE